MIGVKFSAAARHAVVTLAIPLVLTSCFLAPGIHAFHQLGVTAGDREGLLPKEVQKFQEALFWGSSGEAMKYVAESSEASLRTQLQRPKKDERIVESEVENVEFTNESNEASVEIRVKYFKVPFYIVADRVETQAWTFSVGDGWKIRDRVVSDVG